MHYRHVQRHVGKVKFEVQKKKQTYETVGDVRAVLSVVLCSVPIPLKGQEG